MRRFNSPFNGQRYLLNTNTGEIHDLDNEFASCQIDKIKLGHIRMGDTYAECHLGAVMLDCPQSNGCYYCLREKDNG